MDVATYIQTCFMSSIQVYICEGMLHVSAVSLHTNNKLVMNSVNRACAELVVDLYIYKVFLILEYNVCLHHLTQNNL